ncbi:MAG: DUF4829 domain-containing protein [Clostridia bacterium]|nr:DUF4829 domain-containing protein [Clostridia bacterium]
MRSEASKRIFALILMLMVVAAAFLLLQRKQPSPTEVVEQYFAYWNEKDTEKQNTLVAERIQSSGTDEAYLECVELLSCDAETRQDKLEGELERIRENWEPDASYAAVVYVTYDIEYADNASRTNGLENGTYDWTFWLARQSKDEPWMIVAYGV